jgi:transcriptional regulator of acetoin/glycerol metabolism
LTCSGRYIAVKDLKLAGSYPQKSADSLRGGLLKEEEQILRSTLKRNNWNVTLSAKDLGISRMTLYRRMEKHGISREK